MSNLVLVCRTCGETTSSFFIVVGDKMICNKCKSNKKIKDIPKFQKPRVFTRWICKTHHCGTYNVNNMFFRHLMKDCEIKSQETLGIIRPATFGGINGDIGRNNFLGINEMDLLKTNLNNYKRFVMIHFRVGKKKVSYTSMKYHNKHLRFINTHGVPDFHKYDELFQKLKFNYNLYLESIPQKFKTSMLTNEERSRFYYKNLMENFVIQVKSR